jgi:hypothetical protein
MYTRLLTSFSASLALIGLLNLIEPLPLEAQVYDIYVGMKYGSDINTALLKLTGVSTATPTSAGPDEWAGPISLQVTPQGTTDTRVFESYCIGLFETVYVNNTYQGEPRAIPEPSDPINPSNAVADATRRAAVIYNTWVTDAAASKEKGAALQTAIWTAMYPGFAYTGVQDNGATYDPAHLQQFQSQVATYYSALTGADLADPKYNANQWVFYDYSTTPKTMRNVQFLIGPVPEPAEMAMIGVGLIGTLMCVHRYRRPRCSAS